MRQLELGSGGRAGRADGRTSGRAGGRAPPDRLGGQPEIGVYASMTSHDKDKNPSTHIHRTDFRVAASQDPPSCPPSWPRGIDLGWCWLKRLGDEDLRSKAKQTLKRTDDGSPTTPLQKSPPGRPRNGVVYMGGSPT